MKTYFIYSIYDTKSNEYGLPFFALNDDTAKRQFLLFTAGNAFATEFELRCLGSFEPEGNSESQQVAGSLVRTIPCTELEFSSFAEKYARSKGVSDLMVGKK